MNDYPKLHLPFDDESHTLWMTGQATTLSNEPDEDIIERLHAVVAEITGRPVLKPQKPRMGFL